MKGNVPIAEATHDEVVLPERVQEALGQLVGAAREGLLALSVEVGLTGRSRSVGAASRSGGRGRGPRMTSQRFRFGPMSISRAVTSSARSCSSGCSPASRPESTAAPRNRSARKSRLRRGYNRMLWTALKREAAYLPG